MTAIKESGHLGWNAMTSEHALSDFVSKSSTPFNPSQLPGLQLWLDATDNNTITGNPVSQWLDKSPNALAFTDGNLPTLVSNGINGKQVLFFDGTHVQELVNVYGGTGSPVLSSSSGFYFYFVIKNTDGNLQSSALFPFSFIATPAAASPTLQFSGGTVFGWMAFAGDGTQGWTNDGPCISGSSSNPFVPATNPYDIGVESSNGFATLANFSIYVNGVAQTVANCTANLGTTSSTQNLLLTNNSVSYYLGEIVLGNQALNASQRTQLQNYLKNKWGV